MAYQIVVKKRFTNKVQKVLAYLEKNGQTKLPLILLSKLTGALSSCQNSLILGRLQKKFRM